MGQDINYTQLSTVELLERIVRYADRNALDHFLEKRKIIYHNDQWFLISEYVLYLCTQRIPYHYYPTRFIDREEFEQWVNGLTIRGFITLDEAEKTPDNGTITSVLYVDRKFSDCRKYYQHVLAQITSDAGTLQAEQDAGKELINLIFRRFWYSLKEVHRQANPLQKRYNWNVKKGTIIVYRPAWIPGREFRTWLEKHISDPEPTRKGESRRIQNKVDSAFKTGYFIEYDTHEENRLRTPGEYDSPFENNHQSADNALAYKVALKKSWEIDQLRPAIRSLGKEKVQRLVLRILEDISDRCYSYKEIIREFGISKATLSRFAGIHWEKSSHKDSVNIIPDLWRNVAEVVMSDSDFIEAAVAVGVNNVIDIVMKGSGNKGISDE